MDDNRVPKSINDERSMTQHKGKQVAIIDFEELAGEEPLVLIRLGAEVYELRRTRAGKLVLHK